MITRFILSFIILLLGKAAAWALSPIIPLLSNREGKVRKVFYWAVTHDDNLNAWWRDSFDTNHWLKRRYTQEDFDNKYWVRWFSQMKWIQRNPAYGLAHILGYSQKGMILTKHKDEGHLWDKGWNNTSYYTAVNEKGNRAFMLQWQWHYYKEWCIEVYLGWKLFRSDPDQKCMMAIRISPFRKYER